MWTKEAPKEPGFYWYYSVYEGEETIIMITLFGDGLFWMSGPGATWYTAEELLENAGMFWSEQLVEPAMPGEVKVLCYLK